MKNPENFIAPLVEIPDSINCFRVDGVRIYAQLMTNFGHIKFGPINEILSQFETEGKLEDIHTSVIATSGNAGEALAQLAPEYGIKNTIILIPPNLPKGKIDPLRESGANIKEVSNGIMLAREMGQKKGYINIDQYSHPGNPRFFKTVTAPQIWCETKGGVTIFAAGLGTGGTFAGSAHLLKEKNPNLRALGVVVKKGKSVPAVRTWEKLAETQQPFNKFASVYQFVDDFDAFAFNWKMIQQGIDVGPSSGFALAGLLKELHRARTLGYLDKLRNKDGEVIACFIAADSQKRYKEEYPKYL